MKKMLFIINPYSGVDRIKALQYSIEKHLDHQQFAYDILYTEYAGHGTLLAREAVAGGVDIVVAVGGDGSVNDIINGIYGTPAALAIIPKGSGNGLARSLGIPMNVDDAVRFLNTSELLPVDLGRADGHLFASNAGVGFDTLVAQKFAASRRRGLAAYTGIIGRHLWRYAVRNWEIEVDGMHFFSKAFLLTVANGIQLGYGFKIAPLADLQDGLFDVIIIKKFPKLLASVIALRAFAGSILRSPYVTSLKGKNIVIHHPEMSLLQLDGEVRPCGPTVRMEVLPGALNVWTKPMR